MLYALEKYNKNEAPLVVYHVYGDGSKIDSEIMDNMLKFLTILSKLNGEVWVIANYENTIVKETQVKLNALVKKAQVKKKLDNIVKEARVKLNTFVKEAQVKLNTPVKEAQENENLNTNVSFFYLIQSNEVHFPYLFYF